MKALTINIDMVVQSMRDVVRESNDFYLDLSTGRVLSLSRELLKFMAQEREGECVVIPNWDEQMIPVAREIVISGSLTYIRIPEMFGRPELHWMKEFAETIRGAKLKQKVLQLLKGRGASIRFKETMKDNIEESARWSQFCQSKWKEEVQCWLEKHSILAVAQKPSKKRASA